MLRYLSSIFLLLTGFSSTQDIHLINWKPGRRLNWEDFQGKPDPKSENAALTSTHINFQYTTLENKFSYNISCQFNKKQSWSKVHNEMILNHEQAHFDLAELYARKLKIAVSNYNIREGSIGQDLDSIYEAVMKEHHIFQQNYDLETDHSRNLSQQVSWQKKINDSLIVRTALASNKH